MTLARAMIEYYRPSLIDLFIRVQAIQANPMEAHEECYAIQQVLIQRIIYVEGKFKECKTKAANLRKQLAVRQTKEKAQEIKDRLNDLHGRTPLTGGRACSHFARSPSRSFRPAWVRKRSSAGTAASLRFAPRGGSDFVAQQLTDTPDMISQSRGHSRRAQRSPTPFPARGIAHRTEFVMGPTEVIGAAQQIHASV